MVKKETVHKGLSTLKKKKKDNAIFVFFNIPNVIGFILRSPFPKTKFSLLGKQERFQINKTGYNPASKECRQVPNFIQDLSIRCMKMILTQPH